LSFLDTIRLHVPSARVTPDKLYLVRTPNGSLLPGRIVETRRLWEMRLADPAPHLSAERIPSRSEARVVGYLALALHLSDPTAADLAALLEQPQWVLPDEADDADRAVQAWDEVLSTAGNPPPKPGGSTFQAHSLRVLLTVADPRRIRRF
jgi:hypothetical protein